MHCAEFFVHVSSDKDELSAPTFVFPNHLFVCMEKFETLVLKCKNLAKKPEGWLLQCLHISMDRFCTSWWRHTSEMTWEKKMRTAELETSEVWSYSGASSCGKIWLISSTNIMWRDKAAELRLAETRKTTVESSDSSCSFCPSQCRWVRRLSIFAGSKSRFKWYHSIGVEWHCNLFSAGWLLPSLRNRHFDGVPQVPSIVLGPGQPPQGSDEKNLV